MPIAIAGPGAIAAAVNFVKLDVQPIETDLRFDKDFMMKFLRVQKANTYVPQHSHPFEHTTVLAHGSVRVWVGSPEGEGKDHRAPAMINIPAHTKHTFMTLEDDTVLICANRLDENGNVRIEEEHQIVEAR